MRTTSLRLIVLAVVCGSGLVLARAQETPETLTGGEYRCQIAFGKALIDLSIETGECLVTCRTSPGGQCSLFLPDAITADCLSRARADADIRVLSRCAGSDCPECYGGGGDCPGYASPAFSQATSLIDMAVSVLYCNDALSADGLTRDEQRCQSGLSRASGQFIEELGRCFQRCAERVRHGTTQFSSCESAFLDTPAFDDRTQRCVEAARMGLLAACDRRCEDPPDCFGLSCMDAAAILESQLLGFQSTTSCEDVPPPECGDGRVTGGEVCDPSAFPNGCPPDLDCFGCFFCAPPPPVCGDGQVTPGETCDASASPNGCAAEEACVGCQACVGPCGNGTIDPDEECDPAAAPSGCAAGDLCTQSCTCEPCHDPCETGGALEPQCSPCVASVCEQDAFCCDVSWDSVCVNEARGLCGLGCGSPNGAFLEGRP